MTVFEGIKYDDFESLKFDPIPKDNKISESERVRSIIQEEYRKEHSA